MKKDPKNHLGHFERIREKVASTDVYDMDDVLVLEMVLQGVLRRADTNEIAHNLINEFGSFKELYTNSSLERLKSIKGIGDAIALKLYAMLKTYSYANLLPKEPVSGRDEPILYVKKQFSGLKAEKVLIFIVDKNNDIATTKIIAEGDMEHAAIDIVKLIETIKYYKGHKVVLAHNHIIGGFFPSKEDLSATIKIYSALSQNGIQLLDHIIVSEQGYFSFANSYLMVVVKARAEAKYRMRQGANAFKLANTEN